MEGVKLPVPAPHERVNRPMRSASAATTSRLVTRCSATFCPHPDPGRCHGRARGAAGPRAASVAEVMSMSADTAGAIAFFSSARIGYTLLRNADFPAVASAERSDDLGQPQLDGHPPGIPGDQVPEGGGLLLVGDDHGGLVAAQAGDDQLADGAGVAGQAHGLVLVDFGLLCGRPLVIRSHKCNPSK